MALEALLRPDGPWLHPLVDPDSATWDLLQSLPNIGKARVAVRLVRGKKMRTTPALFDEFAAALQFPWYFGENWDAFDECLTDLEWLPADAYTVLVSNGVHLLEAEPSEQLTLCLRALEQAGREWSKPKSGEFASAARPFHVLLQCTHAEERSLREKLTAAKVSFSPIK
jgi:RNAse (barnase) inhibitor barstar